MFITEVATPTITLSLPIMFVRIRRLFRQTLTDDGIVIKIRGEIEDEDGAETDKGGEEIDASADTQETPEISAQDALNAITTLQTFFMQKTDTSDSTFTRSMLQKLNELIETYKKKNNKNNCPSHSFCL